MTGYPELPVTQLLITDPGGHTYRLTFGNQRRYVAIIATGSQLDRWAADIRAAISAPPARPRLYADGQYARGFSAERP